MGRITDQLRLAMAERMLGWVLGIVPKGHPDSSLIIKHIHEYLKQKVLDQEKEDLERRWKWDPEGTYFSEMEERKKNEHK